MIVTERTAEAHAERLILDVKLFGVTHSLDDLRQSAFECGEITHRLLKQAIGELSVVVA